MKDRAKRLELCEKSLKAFGVKYRWKRLLEKGTWKEDVDEFKRKIKRWVPVDLTHVEKVMDIMIERKEKASGSTEKDNNDTGSGSNRSDSKELSDNGGQEAGSGQAGSDTPQPLGAGGDS